MPASFQELSRQLFGTGFPGGEYGTLTSWETPWTDTRICDAAMRKRDNNFCIVQSWLREGAIGEELCLWDCVDSYDEKSLYVKDHHLDSLLLPTIDLYKAIEEQVILDLNYSASTVPELIDIQQGNKTFMIIRHMLIAG